MVNDRTEIVAATLLEVSRAREQRFHEHPGSVRTLLALYRGKGSVADLLWKDLPRQYEIQDVADLLAMWSWMVEDNGREIHRAAERWITGCCDSKQIAVALSLDALPFIDPEVCIVELRKVEAVFPELRECCERVIEIRRRELERIPR
jgi:hypothetical protein